MLLPKRKVNLERIKEIIVDRKQEEKLIFLEDEIDKFIDWYYESMIKGKYEGVGKYYYTCEMKNLIDKIAVWYELNYPEYALDNRLELLDKCSSEVEISYDKFLKLLSCNEKYLMSPPRYPEIVYLDSRFSPHLHLTQTGIVESSEGIGPYTNYTIKDKELEGMHLEKAISLMKEKKISLPNDNELETTLNYVKTKEYQIAGMLDAAMYRIIERGGKRTGPRRAFLFAREFGRNIDIPMKYSIDYSDPGLRRFVNSYIKSGGRTNLVCYVDYYFREKKYQKLETVTVQELIMTLHDNAFEKYTDEEKELHQRLVDTLSVGVEKEKIKQLTLPTDSFSNDHRLILYTFYSKSLLNHAKTAPFYATI